jgi:hypothetical protein
VEKINAVIFEFFMYLYKGAVTVLFCYRPYEANRTAIQHLTMSSKNKKKNIFLFARFMIYAIDKNEEKKSFSVSKIYVIDKN